MGSLEEPQYDVLIVGAGFSGIYTLHMLRNAGVKCKVYEAGADIGGIWYWNAYPGCRVDSEVPVYEYSAPELWKDWTWTEKYPGRAELRRYFDHVDKVWEIKKDVEFNVRVIGGQFDVTNNIWKIETDDGRTTTCRFFIPATGFAGIKYIPNIKGIESFKGEMHHPWSWPREGVDVKGKRVGVIGTGASGVQIIQEIADEVEELLVFQRTPNLALPMRQSKLVPEEQEIKKPEYPQFYETRITTFGGMKYDFKTKKTADDTPEEREAFFEGMWERGGFEYWLAGYKDTLLDPEANRHAYDFWAKKTRERINDPQKRDFLAPLEPIHPFGTKRPALEQHYYEVFNKPNVYLINLRKNGIEEIKPDGILLSDGSFHRLDVIAMATGYDSITGALTNMGLRDIHGTPLADGWKGSTMSYLGMCRHGYPNMFYMYGPNAPTSFSNGPTTAEVQGNWIASIIQTLQEKGIRYIEAKAEAEVEWKTFIDRANDRTLFPLTDSYYMGANIPGKKREQLNWVSGLPAYLSECNEALQDWDKFVTA
ncbi:hypothetical protein LOZ12_005217 [Ophidiomyces ophidiicola]|uniref:uncharacterized protein n=1 Tax=Ophidiomyces ophidiicola TaxID=1387563 RepID=UPI0020C2AB98|nr:uncharacterized protein LOZ57_001189 [Ophidiomyces ophidiicola]KAI1936972.1 hypothetical protein LOZ62_005583 [Ophidiomyces ophidiicola]KAI1951777.1 hypothetical protein LOZ57_001189 [Ophidiomyces ophidiicola]KAI2046844.1 hypothetical protein LOZ38_005188 [Ophidiomyces ophidiicola]KAI2055562.1 hypothetical protein LOZ44_002100 [Ophidiomyces ophidiicola]KAI2058614.1 hypothetical protein LOZ43_002536 [Ophidiomyces ophidiicola]